MSYQVFDEEENDEKKCCEQNLKFSQSDERKQPPDSTGEQGRMRCLVATHRTKFCGVARAERWN